MSRRRQNTPLGWFLVISLLLNHAVVLPVAFHLLTSDRSDSTREPETLEVELVDPPARPEPVQPDERRQPSSALQRKVARLTPRKKKPRRPRQPPEKKRTEKKKKKKKKKELVEPPPPPEAMRLKMVEVNNPESEKPPPNARFLSDKNRRVKRETRARHTNLVKDHPRPRPMSLPSPMRHTRPGSKQKKVAETRQQKAQKVHPLLAMRPRPSKKRKEEVKPLTESAMDGTLPRPQKAQRGRPRLNLDHHSHDRIYGKEARRQRELARLAPSKSRGRGSRWKQIKSALENFIPEVQPGNQTALGTRANPFAVYIARMHRRIHRLWGYGLLVDLDLKSDSNPMNDMKLWSMIEVVVLPDGKVEKATIVKHSGYLPYDVAALNTIFTSSPYQATPRAIRSADGKVYMHWRFHRDQRQCGTFGVDPYILTKPPAGPVDGDMTEVGRRGGTGTRKVRRLNRRRGGVSRGHTASRPAQGTQSTSQQKAVRRAALIGAIVARSRRSRREPA